jgi:hypothetical protein
MWDCVVMITKYVRGKQWFVKIIAVLDIRKLFVKVSFESDDQTTQRPNGSICKVVTTVDRIAFSHLVSEKKVQPL